MNGRGNCIHPRWIIVTTQTEDARWSWPNGSTLVIQQCESCADLTWQRLPGSWLLTVLRNGASETAFDSTQFQAIVKELADNDPLINTDVESNPSWLCPHCSAGWDNRGEESESRHRDRAFVEQDHRPSCLWVRARKLTGK